MRRNQGLFAAVAATFLAASTCADASPAAQQKIASVQYLVGTWNCSHTVGTLTYDFPPTQSAKSEPGVHAEYFMGFDERRQAWVRFGVMSTGQYFAIRMTDTGDSGWSWKYVSFFKTQQPEAPGSDATFTKKSDFEYTVEGPSYEENDTRVTEHHVCKKL
jgi:hypothetical protein